MKTRPFVYLRSNLWKVFSGGNVKYSHKAYYLCKNYYFKLKKKSEIYSVAIHSDTIFNIATEINKNIESSQTKFQITPKKILSKDLIVNKQKVGVS